MASPAFPPTPQAAPGGAPQGGAPSPVGTAAAGAQPQVGQMIQQFKSSLQNIIMFQKAISKIKPEAGQKMGQGIATIMESIRELTGQASPGPTQPQGAVPPPPQMAAESPEQTPEAT